jgi:UDP-GlcNAc:undecaprenyl-phosphate GlcNAc-1-phosphate transferase
MVALAISLGSLALVEPASRLQALDWSDVTRSLPAVVLIFITGLLDDLIGLTPWQKLAGQVGAATLACVSGVQIASIGGYSVADAWWHIPLTVVWLVGCSNAFNLIDGLDGLAAGIGLFATLTTLVAAIATGNAGLALATAPLAGALLGFLCYNFNPATIFLGDCGSLSIGFLLGCAGVIWSQKSATVLGMTAPLIALCIPIADTALSICRRLLQGRPIFAPDRRHIHHRLLDLGLTPRRVALLMYGVAGIAAACSLLVSLGSSRFGPAVVVVCVVGAWCGIQRLQYFEFQEARRVLFGGAIARLIHDSVALRHFEDELRLAGAPDACWEVLTGTCRKLGFNKVRLDFCGRSRVERLGAAADHDCWDLRIPLNGHGVVEFSLRAGSTPHPATLAPFANLVRRHFLAVGAEAGEKALYVAWNGAAKAESKAVRHG